MATTDRNDDSAVDAFLSAHSPVESGARFAAGTVVGDWRLTGFLGRGGSSEVYGRPCRVIRYRSREDSRARRCCGADTLRP